MKNVYTIVARKVAYSVMRGRNRESESVKTAYTHVGHIPTYPLSLTEISKQKVSMHEVIKGERSHNLYTSYIMKIIWN